MKSREIFEILVKMALWPLLICAFSRKPCFFTKNDFKWFPRHIGTSLDTQGVTEASLEALAPIERVDIFSHVGFTSQNEAIL